MPPDTGKNQFAQWATKQPYDRYVSMCFTLLAEITPLPRQTAPPCSTAD